MAQIKHILMAGLLILVVAMVSGFIKMAGEAQFLKIPDQENSFFCGTPDCVFPTDGSATSTMFYDGKKLFTTNCASCHNIFKDGTGPKLGGISSHEKWSDRKELLKWINNPVAYMENDSYTRALKEKFGSVMTPFPQITMEELESIVLYIDRTY